MLFQHVLTRKVLCIKVRSVKIRKNDFLLPPNVCICGICVCLCLFVEVCIIKLPGVLYFNQKLRPSFEGRYLSFIFTVDHIYVVWIGDYTFYGSTVLSEDKKHKSPYASSPLLCS